MNNFSKKYFPTVILKNELGASTPSQKHSNTPHSGSKLKGGLPV